MHVLLIFLDGVGLGDDDPTVNPFTVANTPTLHQLSNGKKWLRTTGLQHGFRSVFIPTDPLMGVAGKPQSGTGQAAIISGQNIPRLIGRHYGPKPDAVTRAFLDQSNFFSTVVNSGKTAALLEAYPVQWHRSVERGKRLPASYQYAAMSAGLRLMGEADLLAGQALSGDWTGEGWHRELGLPHIPLLTPYEAGVRMVELSRLYDFSFMAHWLTDVAGHRGTIERGIELIERFDRVMTGVLDAWDDAEGVILVTSDHGNIEDLSHRHHTENNVPTVVIGQNLDLWIDNIKGLHDLVPVMKHALLS